MFYKIKEKNYEKQHKIYLVCFNISLVVLKFAQEYTQDSIRSFFLDIKFFCKKGVETYNTHINFYVIIRDALR